MTSIDDAIADGISTMTEDGGPFTEFDSETPSVMDGAYDKPDPKFIDDPKPPRKAVEYQNKVAGVLSTAYNLTAENQKTVADGAAILMYGDDFAEACGKYAAENEKAARIIDLLTEGTDNAALALIATAVPFTLQLIRNHEPTVETTTRREIRMFGRVWRPKFSIRLKAARKFTRDPHDLVAYVYSDEEVLAHVAKKKLRIPGVNA